jgi:hypothetical protein
MTGMTRSAWQTALLGIFSLVLSALVLSACGGGGASGNAPRYTLSVDVTGLPTGKFVVLQNGNDNLTVSGTSDGHVTGTFQITLPQDQAYQVTVKNQPNGLYCSITQNGSGTISANVTVSVSCSSNVTVGGSVSGLNSATLVLKNGTDKVSLTANGPFSFTLPVGSAYSIQVDTQPSGQACAVTSGGSGTASAPVSNIAVTCGAATVTIGGTITGLANGSSVTLQLVSLDGVQTLQKTGTGGVISFTFYGVTSALLNSNSTYNVTVSQQPSGQQQICLVSNGSGPATADVTNVSVTCVQAFTVSVNVSGLSGTLVLQDNGADDLTITQNGGPFTFNTPVAVNSTYTVTVKTYPTGQLCTVSPPSGTVTTAVTLQVDCVAGYTVGGTVSGLAAGASMTLRNNGGDDLIVKGTNGGSVNFVFHTPIADGANYSVSIASQPAPQACKAPVNASGTISGANVTNVAIGCPPPSPAVTVSYGVKQISFDWSPGVSGATSYTVSERAHGTSSLPVVITPANFTDTRFTYDIPVHQLDWPRANYVVSACNAGGCADATTYNSQNNAFAPGVINSYRSIGYVKASNTAAPIGQTAQNFGRSVAVSADGNTVAIGAPGEASNGSSQSDTSVPGAGAVYVFVRDTTTGAWTQQAYVKASDAATDGVANFGSSVALSSDGNTLAVGASNASVVAQDNTGSPVSIPGVGAMYVFTRSGTTWTQDAKLAPTYVNSTPGCADSSSGRRYSFGSSASLSADGNTLAIGALTESSNNTIVPGFNDGAPWKFSCSSGLQLNWKSQSGAVYVFTRNKNTGVWSQAQYLKAQDNATDKNFGNAVSLSADGLALAVGAWQDNDIMSKSGAVYVFTLSGGNWSQQAKIKAPNASAGIAGCQPGGGPGGAQFGISVALSGDGATLAVGANGEASSATGVNNNGTATDVTYCGDGAAYVFRSPSWVEEAYIKPSTAAAFLSFGSAVGLSYDGNTLIVGANGETSSNRGVDNGLPNGSGGSNVGAAYVFSRSPDCVQGPWCTPPVGGVSPGYTKASNPTAGANFGSSLAISSDGKTMVSGAYAESGVAKGIAAGGGSSAYTATGSGAAYLY